jgi:hypothetical protein
MFKTTTVNRYLRQWGYDHETLRRQPAVRGSAVFDGDAVEKIEGIVDVGGWPGLPVKMVNNN